MEEPRDEANRTNPAEEGVTQFAAHIENTSPIVQAHPDKEYHASSSGMTPLESAQPTVSSDITISHSGTRSTGERATSAATQEIVSSDLHAHRSVARWLIPLAILIIIGMGLFWVYRYGQNTTTPAALPKKDVALLRIGYPEPLPASIYPNVDDSSFTNDIDNQAFEGLTKFYDLTKVGPQLALSWSNPDTSTWIFKLRPHVKFHTGRTMTASDVKASLDAIQHFPLGPEFGSTIQEVSVLDPLTVKITTNGPDPILPNELTDLFIYDTTSKTPNNPINGTGPYTIKPGTDTKHAIDLVAFDGYYGSRPHVRELIFTSYDTVDEAVVQVNAGKVDISNVFTKVNADKITSPNYTTIAVPSPTVAHLVPNTLNGGPLSKLAVRQALMQAIDVSVILNARGLVGTPATQTVAPSIPGYDPAVTRPPYDVAAAKRILASAGYPNGFSFNFTYYSSAQTLADELKRQLALVGVTVIEDPQTNFDSLAAKVFGGQTDMYYNSLSTSLVDGSDFFSPVILDSKNYNNPAITAVFTQASQTLDQAKRLKLLQQVSDMMVADRADLPLYVTGDLYFEIPKNLVIKQESESGDMGVHFSEAYEQ